MEKKESRKNARTYILKPGEIIPPKYDFIFTQIFNDPNYGFALNKLLADTLNMQEEDFIGNVIYRNRNLRVKSRKNALGQVDLIVKRTFKEGKNDKEEYINIEVNSSLSMSYRNKVYSNSIGANTLNVGDKNYKDIPRVIQLNYNFFDYHSNKFITVGKMLNDDGTATLGWADEIYHIFSNFVLKSWYNDADERERKVAKWCMLMFADTEETLLKRAKEVMSEEEARKFVDRVVELSHDDDNIALYTGYSNHEMAFNTDMAYIQDEKAKIQDEKTKVQDEKAKIQDEMTKVQDEKAKIQNEKTKVQEEKSQIQEEREKLKKEKNDLKAKATKENSLNIAKNMLANNLDINLIANITGLSIEEINSIEE